MPGLIRAPGFPLNFPMSAQKATVSNVLAERYATAEICGIWSTAGKVGMERDLWIAVLKTQRALGIAIPDGAIEAYEKARDQIDLDSITEREQVTRHDVKSRIEEFNGLAGFEQVHKGMTSRDLTENVEQLQVYRSLAILMEKSAAALHQLAEKAEEYKDLVLTGRTHNVAAQPTTFGKRLAMFGQELLRGCKVLQNHVNSYPVRGIKGAVGTQLDLATLLGGDLSRVEEFDTRMREYLGLPGSFTAVGQVYPRSLDHETVSSLFQLCSGPSSFARTLRLMAGHELSSEGFAKGQVGSSAMPHKMNSRSCERINGFHAILRGHVAMASSLAGDQWNEGDVSCSVVRRVFTRRLFATDGLLETFLTVLNQMDVYPAVVEAENRRYFPFLSTTTILMEAVQAGVGREAAHQAIKEHAVATVKDLRSGTTSQNDLVDRLAADERLGLEKTKSKPSPKMPPPSSGMPNPKLRPSTEKFPNLLQIIPTPQTTSPNPCFSRNPLCKSRFPCLPSGFGKKQRITCSS